MRSASQTSNLVDALDNFITWWATHSPSSTWTKTPFETPTCEATGPSIQSAMVGIVGRRHEHGRTDLAVSPTVQPQLKFVIG